MKRFFSVKLKAFTKAFKKDLAVSRYHVKELRRVYGPIFPTHTRSPRNAFNYVIRKCL